MPQTVQPPEIPAIISPVTNECSNGTPPVSVTACVGGSVCQQPTQTTDVPAPMASKETLEPEYSCLLNISKSAALLGPPISVGYFVQPKSGIAPDLYRYSTFLLKNDGDQLKTKEQVATRTINRADTKSSAITKFSLGFRHFPVPDVSSRSKANPLIIERILTQERGGKVRELEFSVPLKTTQDLPDAEGTVEEEDTAPQLPVIPEAEVTIPTPVAEPIGVIELTADTQEYDEQRQIVTAEGNVIMRFQGALLDADRVQINLPNRIMVAEGNVTLTRGGQVLRGERFEYYFVQDSGVIFNASGELYTASSEIDLPELPSPDDSDPTAIPRPLSDRIVTNQPLQGVTNPGGYSFVVGSSLRLDPESGSTSTPRSRSGGSVNRFRYEADRVDFEGSEGIATNMRITNDPFSPPELELQAENVRFRRISPLVDEIVAAQPRLVFDQSFSVPTFRNRILIDRRPREPALFNFGFDDDDRGGLFIERPIEIYNSPTVRFSITPQYFLQRAIFDESPIDPSAFGFKSRLDVSFGPRTTLVGSLAVTSLDFDDIDDETRASLRLQQIIGTTLPHKLNLEASYRDRLFNGSLGFQTVRSSIGALLTSPVIPLGQTGINLTYQVGIQNINANTNRLDLLPTVRDNDRINLTRYQAAASLSRGFVLWRGKALPATPEEGLRYTPKPVVPYLAFNTNVRGVTSLYSNGDNQNSISGTVGLVGQIGHFSRPFLDYTGFNISFTQAAVGDLSPFLFDRVADRSVLSGGITQQLYGPFRLGFQTSFNLNTGQEISTDYFLEYRRRSYNVILRYNPVQGLGSLSLRISDFNWTGNPGRFDGRPVIQGVTQ
ncbi:MAG: DUF3769 domain-containing protein [Symploca sp. SIO1A3]|nr:DUF3769 domain-containing protein [Symploca sp. SIO2C1]NER51245.1 DUF3769 domain-containing protein [Symploca sp. SIO1A3]